MPNPLMVATLSPPHLGVSRSPVLGRPGRWWSVSGLVLCSSSSSLSLTTSEASLKRSSASARHWFSLPKRHKRNKPASRPDTMSVNQAPSGTLFRAELRYSPSTQAKKSQGRTTAQGGRRHTSSATSVVMHVSKKDTNMTQTPYALPRLVVLLYTAKTRNKPPNRNQKRNGTYSCPWKVRDVCTTLTCGQYESFMIWLINYIAG